MHDQHLANATIDTFLVKNMPQKDLQNMEHLIYDYLANKKTTLTCHFLLLKLCHKIFIKHRPFDL